MQATGLAKTAAARQVLATHTAACCSSETATHSTALWGAAGVICMAGASQTVTEQASIGGKLPPRALPVATEMPPVSEYPLADIGTHIADGCAHQSSALTSAVICRPLVWTFPWWLASGKAARPTAAWGQECAPRSLHLSASRCALLLARAESFHSPSAARHVAMPSLHFSCSVLSVQSHQLWSRRLTELLLL